MRHPLILRSSAQHSPYFCQGFLCHPDLRQLRKNNTTLSGFRASASLGLIACRGTSTPATSAPTCCNDCSTLCCTLCTTESDSGSSCWNDEAPPSEAPDKAVMLPSLPPGIYSPGDTPSLGDFGVLSPSSSPAVDSSNNIPSCWRLESLPLLPLPSMMLMLVSVVEHSSGAGRFQRVSPLTLSLFTTPPLQLQMTITEMNPFSKCSADTIQSGSVHGDGAAKRLLAVFQPDKRLFGQNLMHCASLTHRGSAFRRFNTVDAADTDCETL